MAKLELNSNQAKQVSGGVQKRDAIPIGDNKNENKLTSASLNNRRLNGSNRDRDRAKNQK